MDTKPIGIFDSGVGGLSVFKEIIKILPNEDIIYFADSKNNPYGNKSTNEIIKLSKKITEFLLSENCKIIVIACNTATSKAINILRQNYNINFIGMEPATKPAALNTKTGNIAVLATKGTLESKKFKKTKSEYASNVNVYTTIGKGLVKIVENNEINTKKSKNLLQQYIEPMIKNKVDQIVLGCTHYPFLCNDIKKIIGKNDITIINPATPVAIHTKNILNENNLLNKSNKNRKFTFYSSSKNTINFKNILQNYLNINTDIITLEI